jgi:hypothetical protein
MSITARFPPKADDMPPDFMMPRTVKVFGPSIVCRLILSSIFVPVRAANSRVTINESGCAMNTSGSSITISSPASRSYSRKLLSPSMSTPSTRMFPSAPSRRFTTASMTGTAVRTPAAFWTRSRISSPNPVSPEVTCNCVAPAILSTVRVKALRTLWFAVCIPTNTATPSTMPAIVSSVRSLCLRTYCQVISRSSLIRARPAPRARRAAQSAADSFRQPLCRASRSAP